jgi:Fe2+ or Zn2+ uptake regulation protein
MTKGHQQMKSNNAFLHFLNLTASFENEPIHQIDLQSKKILETIAWRHQSGQALTVTQAMHMDHIASAATIHRKLDHLRDLGLVQTIYQGNNRRTKFMAPTKLSNRYFEKINKVMHKACNAHLSLA